MQTIHDAFTNRIKFFMKEKNFCNYTLSIKSAIPNSTIYNFLNGNTNTGIENIVNICRGLEVSLPEFFASADFLFENLCDD